MIPILVNTQHQSSNRSILEFGRLLTERGRYGHASGIPIVEERPDFFIAGRGNLFFAYSLKDKVVNWLDPKPRTYKSDGFDIEDLNGYLEK